MSKLVVGSYKLSCILYRHTPGYIRLNWYLVIIAGMLAAEAAFEALENSEQPSMDEYWNLLQRSWVWKELQSVRNIRPVWSFLPHLFKILSI